MRIRSFFHPFRVACNKYITCVKILFCFIQDCKFYLRYSHLTSKPNKNQLATKIMLTMHQLEKGLSMKKNPRVFGKEKALVLIDYLEQYKRKYEIDNLYKLALNVLYEYSKDKWSDKSEIVQRKLGNVLDENKKYLIDNYAGTKEVFPPTPFDKDAIKTFFFSRNSVRDFSDEMVGVNSITNAIEFAKCTPSACNRQTSRVYYFNQPEKIREIIENQLGSQGWCQNARGLVVITSNQCFFGGIYERNQAFIDGGLYAMNFVYGLHIQNIASCFKMYVREPRIDREFREITGIKEEEIPIVLILLGHYKKEFTLEPKSVRL